MFQLETRWIILTLVVVAWTIPVYMLMESSNKLYQLQESEKDLKLELATFKAQFNLLGEQIQPQKRFLHEIVKRDLIGEAGETSVKKSISTNVNIFVETHQNQGTHKQFYKTIDDKSSQDLYNHVKQLPVAKRKRILVTGGAGFVGSHLVDSLMLDGHDVTVCDNFHTGRIANIEHWQNNPQFRLITHDVVEPLDVKVDEIYHLASPASPVHYMSDPIKTIRTNSIGTMNMLELANKHGARIIIASTSEVYGDPEVHPQSETYWGNVNPIGPRSCYDESKRLSESLTMAYGSRKNVSIGIARIFNTFGPRMHPNDGRVVSNFIIQTIGNKSLTVYGSGAQTRSFQYVTDLVSGLKKLMNSDVRSPINLGNPSEMSINSLAVQIKSMVPNSSSDIVNEPLPVDDPHRRKPDIKKAMRLLDWRPVVPLSEGLERTIEYFNQELLR